MPWKAAIVFLHSLEMLTVLTCILQICLLHIGKSILESARRLIAEQGVSQVLVIPYGLMSEHEVEDFRGQ